MAKNIIKDKLKEMLGDAKEETVIETTEASEVVELNGLAVDLVKEGKDYKRVYIAYNLETGDAKVVNVITDGNRSKSLSLQRTIKFISDKLMLNKKEMI